MATKHATKRHKRVWIESHAGWVQGCRGSQQLSSKDSKSNKAEYKVHTDDGDEIIGVTFPVKHNGRRSGNIGIMKPEKLPERRGRYRRRISVVPVRYVPGQSEVYADYDKMLREHVNVDGTSLRVYANAVMGFNDNHNCFLRYLNHKDANGPQGGNAIARPWQISADSVAIPTGPYSSLDENTLCMLPGDTQAEVHTAKDVIDAGIKAIVHLFMAHPEKDTLYYAVNHTDQPGADCIGIAIFAGAVGMDVREYITSELKRVPYYVQALR